MVDHRWNDESLPRPIRKSRRMTPPTRHSWGVFGPRAYPYATGDIYIAVYVWHCHGYSQSFSQHYAINYIMWYNLRVSMHDGRLASVHCLLFPVHLEEWPSIRSLPYIIS